MRPFFNFVDMQAFSVLIFLVSSKFVGVFWLYKVRKIKTHTCCNFLVSLFGAKKWEVEK